jgi:thymidylate synthase (FAD)
MAMNIHPKIPLLDHGYIQLIEVWGSDERIIESARMSTSGAFRGWGPTDAGPCRHCDGGGTTTPIDDPESQRWTCQTCDGSGRDLRPGDEKLLRYLYENKHSTPFEFGGLVVEVQAPILVFREWHRHRTQSYTEMSARYSPLPDLNYVPTPERCLFVNGQNKQANAIKGAETLTHEAALGWLGELADVYEHAQRVYERGLAIGIPKELARLPVPVGRYSRMRAATCLRNWLGFLTLRSDLSVEGGAAQWEIRQFANALGTMLIEAFPRTMELFCEKARQR